MTPPYSVCLVYPNTKSVGSSNLGFQKIFMLLRDIEGLICDVAFLPEPEERASSKKGGSTNRLVKQSGIVSDYLGRNLNDFDLIAFSVTFEMDEINLLKILGIAGIPFTSDERLNSVNRLPVIMAGGVAATLNPEPLSRFIDFFILGEGETVVDGDGRSAVEAVIERLRSRREEAKESTLLELAAIEGVYVPSLYEVEYDDKGRIIRRGSAIGAPETVKRLINVGYRATGMSQLENFSSTMFKGTFLVETGKGCGSGCRFCAAGFIYRPVRHVDIDVLKEQVDLGLTKGRRIGLVGSAICEHPDIFELYDRIVDGGGEATVSSLRIGLAGLETFQKLAKGGLKTATVAPEAGSERMRRVINKPLSDEEIIEAAGNCAEAGILNLKLYFLIGLPGESDEDVDAITDLAKKVRDRFIEMSKPHGRAGRVTVSVNPLVPKPSTPFQWEPFESIGSLKEKAGRLKKALNREPNLEFKVEGIREAAFQSLLSTGNRRTGDALMEAYEGDGWQTVLKSKKYNLHYLERRGEDEILPWDFIDSGFGRDYLAGELKKSLADKTTAVCLPTLGGCKKCGEFEGVCF